MRLAILFAACAGLAACGNPSPSADTTDSTANDTLVQVQSEPVTLSDADLLRVCRAGAAFRVGRSVEGIDANVTGAQMVHLSYTRDDGKFFRYDCKAEGDTLRFRMIDEAGPGTGPGTWSGRGSKTTFKLYPDAVELTDDFFDGSTDTKRIEI